MPEGRHYPTEANGDDLLWRHLKTVPAFRALLRAVEARFYRQVPVPKPVLDLGCGDGHFARMALEHPVAAGVDPWWGPLRKAQREEIYNLNAQALGHALPFADHTFGSVVSNSVLEHIEDVQPVLAEANRVLRPGGMLLVTMPSHLFTEYLGGARILGPVGLGHLYRRFFNFISRHAHTDPPQVWAERLARADFSIQRWQYYFSRQALRTLELGHLQGLPSAMLHFLTGHWILAPWEGNLRLTERWVRPYYEEEAAQEGAYLFVMAQKTAHSRVAQDPTMARRLTGAQQLAEAGQPPRAHLPPPDPLPVKEPRIGTIPTGDAQTPEPSSLPSPGFPAAPFRSALAEVTVEERQQPPGEGRSRTGAGVVGLGLLLLGLLLAVFGQSVLGGQAQSPSGGLMLFALAWLALAAGAIYVTRPPEEERDNGQVAWPRRRLLLLPATLSVFLAMSVTGSTPFEGRPLPALVLWLSGILLAFLGLEERIGQDTNGELRLLHEQQEADGASAEETLLQRVGPRLVLPLALFLLALVVRLVLLTEHPFVLNGIEASIGLDALAVLRGQISNPFATSWLTNPTLPLFFRALPLGLFGPSVLGARLLSALLGALTVPALYAIVRQVWDSELALAASLLLAGYHFHVHYSRLGMSNVWDPLLILMAMGSLAYARRQNTRRAWLLSGVVVGACAYFYTPSHLIPFMLLAIALYLLLLDRAFVARNWPHLLSAMAMAALVALPQYAYYRANPGLFMERANTLGILQTDWLVQEAAASGQSPLAILADHFWKAALAFNASLDTSSTYNPGIPLLRFWPSVFFVVGLGVALTRLRQFRYALILIWLSVTVVFAGALLVGAPDSHRLLVAAPAVVLLVALGVTWLLRFTLRALRAMGGGGRSPNGYFLPIVTLLVLLFVAGDLLFYFGAYRRANRFGDRNTEAAFRIAEYLNTLEGSWTAYFHGPPAMYVSFPTIPFLATEFEPNENLFDVEDPTEALPESDDVGNVTFIYLPERSDEVNVTARRFPDGHFRTVEGRLANPLFYAYEVQE